MSPRRRVNKPLLHRKTDTFSRAVGEPKKLGRAVGQICNQGSFGEDLTPAKVNRNHRIYISGIVWWLYSKFFMTKSIFPWTRNTQCQNSADCLTENSTNYISPICLPTTKSLGLHRTFVDLDIDCTKIYQNMPKSVKLSPLPPLGSDVPDLSVEW